METTEIKHRLHEYVDAGDDKLLKLMYAVAKEYNEDDDFEYTIGSDELAEMELRRSNRLNGNSKTYSWEDAKKIITSKKKLE